GKSPRSRASVASDFSFLALSMMSDMFGAAFGPDGVENLPDLAVKRLVLGPWIVLQSVPEVLADLLERPQVRVVRVQLLFVQSFGQFVSTIQIIPGRQLMLDRGPLY